MESSTDTKKSERNMYIFIYIYIYIYITCNMSPVMCHLPPATCHMSPVTCYMSHVTCHLSPVTCHLTITLCSFSCYKSPRSVGDGIAGDLLIDTIKNPIFPFKKKHHSQRDWPMKENLRKELLPMAHTHRHTTDGYCSLETESADSVKIVCAQF